MSDRVRFSPAPTGSLHIGGARTALFNYLVARASGGSFIVRIEDTDPARTVPGAEESILADLDWLGLEWDEGPDIGGPHAPYRQSERSDAHLALLSALNDAGDAYRCFCSEDALASDRAGDQGAGRPPRYHGACRSIEPGAAAARAAAGELYVWRFAVPEGRAIIWDDGVHGEISVSSDDIGDFVLVRSDGTPTWTFASWADDLSMGVTLVVRGDDHIPNTPRQLLLSDALGVDRGRFAHAPLVTAPGGAPLSKSEGVTAIGELREQGFPAAAVVNHLALLGWSDPDGREVFAMSDLVAAFSLDRVSSSPSVHDERRLRSLSARHLRQLPADELAAAVVPFLPPLPAWAEVLPLIEAARDELAIASDIAGIAVPVLERPDPAGLGLDADALDALSVIEGAIEGADPDGRDGDALLGLARSSLKTAGIAPRVGLHALRIALTGAGAGLPLPVLLALMGVREALKRITVALAVDTPESGKR